MWESWPVAVVHSCSERNEQARVGELRRWLLFMVVRSETNRRVWESCAGGRCSWVSVEQIKKARVDADRSVRRERFDDGVCAAAKLGAILATIRPERAGLPGPARKGSPLFSFLLGLCVCVS